MIGPVIEPMSPNCSVPPVIVVPPEYVLLPLMIRVPLPDLVRLPLPEMTLEIVRDWPAVAVLISPPPLCRINPRVYVSELPV